MEKYRYAKGSLSKALEEAVKLWLQAEALRSEEEVANKQRGESFGAIPIPHYPKLSLSKTHG